jgi:DNA mismatch repair ATPase MutL
VLFDELTAKEWNPDTQELMFPAVKRVFGRRLRLIEEKMELFAGLGFDIEPISESAFAVRGVPAVAAKFDMELFFDEIVDRLQEETQAPDLRKVVIERIACHAAWRAGDAILNRRRACSSTRSFPEGMNCAARMAGRLCSR